MFANFMNKKLLLAVVGVLTIVALSGVAYLNWDKIQDLINGENSTSIAQDEVFGLYTKDEVDGFTTPEASFYLSSKADLSASEVKEILKFEPAIEFEVSEEGKSMSLIPTAYAQEVEEPTAEVESELPIEEVTDETEADAEDSTPNESSVAEQVATKTFKITPSGELKKGETYKVLVLGENTEAADRDYSWAFQIEPDFLVSKTLPRNEATYVPRDSSVEITFTKEVPADIDSYLNITPKFEYETEVQDKTLIIKHGELAEHTVYKVSLDQGLFEENGSAYQDEFSFSFETDSISYNEYSLSFWSDFESFQPSSDKLFNIGYTDLSPEDVKEIYTSTVYKYENADEFLNNYTNSKNWNYYWASWYKRNFGDQVDLEDAQELFTFDTEIIEKDYQNYLYMPNELDNGFYVVELKNTETETKSYVWFQISPVGHYYTYTSKSGLLWLYDFAGEKFVSGVDVELVNSGDSISLGKTNGEGLVTYDTPKELEDNSYSTPSAYKYTYEGNEYISLVRDSSWFGFYYPQADRYWNHLSTDRYVYKPTDSINFWGVTKGRDDDLKNDKLVVTLEGEGYYYYDDYGYFGNNNALAEATAIVSSYDTINGKLSLDGVEPGYYTVYVRKNDDVISSTSVQVVDYTTPAYSIEATPNKDVVFAGDQVEINVTAEFFDGTPVSNTELIYNDYISSNNGDDKTLKLDEDGKATLTLTAKSSQNEFNYGLYSNSIYFRNATTEEGEITASTQVSVFDFDYRVDMEKDFEASSETKQVMTGKINKINLNNTTVDDNGYYRSQYLGDPVGGANISVSFTGNYYEKIEDGFYYDPVSKTTETQYRYEYREDDLGSLSATSDNNGDFQVELNLTEEQAEKYTYLVAVSQVTDGRGQTMKTRHGVYRYEYSPYGDNSNSPTLSFGSSEAEDGLSVGEKFNLDLKIPEVEGVKNIEQKLYFGYQNGISYSEITDEVSLTKEFTKEMKPSIAYQAVVISNKGFEETNRLVATYYEEDSRLNIEMQSDKDSYLPQETAEISLKVTDKDGKGVKSEVNIASVDEALFHILPYEMQRDILEDIYVDNIDNPKSGASRVSDDSLNSASLELGAERGGCFVAGTRVLMANGSYKRIEEIKDGDQVLSFTDSSGKEKEITTVQGTHSYVVDGYIIVNGKLKVTGEHVVFLNGKWDYMGNAVLGDWMLDEDSKKVEIESLEYINAPKTRVYNLNVDKSNTYFADGLYVHNAEKGGAERSEFKDITLFEVIETNSNGEATVDFKLPDNLTSWRVTAKAFENEEILAGQNNLKIPVGLPVFVNVSLNNTYLLEDKPVVSMRAYGDSLVDGDILFSVQSESLGIDESFNSTERSFDVALPELKIGKHEIKFSVNQGDYGDTLVKTIEVVDSYATSYESSEATISDKNLDLSFADNVSNGVVKVVLTDNGKGKFMPILNSARYISNNRLDQVVANKLANEILGSVFGEEVESADLELDQYYSPEGGSEGLALLTYDSADLELTALVTAAVSDYVSSAKLSTYFNEALDNEKADIERASMALYGLTYLKDNTVLPKAKVLVENRESNTVKGNIYLGLTLAELGDKENARQIYADLKSNNLELVDGELRMVDQEMNNMAPLFALLASNVDYKKDAIALRGLLNGYDYTGGYGGLVSVMATQNFINDLESGDGKITLEYGENQTKEFDLSNGYSQSFSLTVEQLKTLAVDKIEGEINLVFNYRELGAMAGNSDNLSINKKFFVNDVETNEFKEGDLVKVVLDLNDSEYSEDIYKNYYVSDFVPAGMKVVLGSNNNSIPLVAREDGFCGFTWGVKKYANSVYLTRGSYIFRSNECSDSDIVYYARVVSKGSYKVQSAQIQEVDNLDNVATSEELFIEIK